MGVLFTIIFHSIGNLFWGILLTLLGIFLLYFLIRSWFVHRTFTPLSFIVGGILFLFLAFQSVLLCGAITIKSYSEDVKRAIDVWVQDIPESVQFTQQDSQVILDNISEEWPLVGYFVNMADFSGPTSANIAEAMTDELCSYMNWFIFRRVAWSVLFVLLGTAGVIWSMDYEQQRSSGRRSTSRGSYGGGRTTRRKRYDD